MLYSMSVKIVLSVLKHQSKNFPKCFLSLLLKYCYYGASPTVLGWLSDGCYRGGYHHLHIGKYSQAPGSVSGNAFYRWHTLANFLTIFFATSLLSVVWAHRILCLWLDSRGGSPWGQEDAGTGRSRDTLEGHEERSGLSFACASKVLFVRIEARCVMDRLLMWLHRCTVGLSYPISSTARCPLCV